jgi:hypothetical protein
MKRPVAVAVATIEAVKAVQATPIQEKKARRGITAAPFAATAAGAAGADGACASPCIEISPRFTIAMLINTIKMTTGSNMAADVAIAITTGGMFNLLKSRHKK